MKLLYPFIAPTVSPEKLQLLERTVFNENLQRSKLFSKLVILFEIILIVLKLSANYVAGRSILNLDFYFIMYIVLLVMSSLMLLLIRRFEKGDTVSVGRYRRFQLGIISFVVFFLLWGVIVTLADQQEYGQLMAFSVNIMCVSILFLASNRMILVLYVIPIPLLLIGLPFFQASQKVLIGHYINLTVFLFFCWLASRMLYTSYTTNLYNKLLLTETNENLALKIEENEKINRELAEVNEKLMRLTLLDELTKIPNRRGLQQYLTEALYHQKKLRKLSFMMIDIDAFKQFNDNYGHLEGDNIIHSIAQQINIQLDPKVSILARYGGEEFIIAVFDLEVVKVTRLAEEIRRAVLDMKIRHEFSPADKLVTVSIGVATGYVINETETEQLKAAADQALYKAKSNGRNQVVACLLDEITM